MKTGKKKSPETTPPHQPPPGHYSKVKLRDATIRQEQGIAQTLDGEQLL